MAAGLDARRRGRIAAQGFGFIEPAAGVRALGELLRRDAVQAGVFPVSWGKFLRQFAAGGEPLLFEELARSLERPARGGGRLSRDDELIARLERAGDDERRGLVLAFLQDQVSQVLAIDPRDLPEPDQPFSEMGFDSLMGIELKNRLGTGLAVDVPLRRFVEAGDLARLTALVVEQLDLARLVDPAVPPAAAGDQMEEFTL
jgi:polyketide synthase 7/polyketide synthase 12